MRKREQGKSMFMSMFDMVAKLAGVDSDGDGVKDFRDCRPFNPFMQDFDVTEAVEKGKRIMYMHPDEYLRRTGFDEKTPKEYYNRYFEKYYDIKKEKMQPISKLGALIKDPKVKVHPPYVGEHPSEHEGRHRAFASKLAGMNSIPVVVPTLMGVPMEVRERLGHKFCRAKKFFDKSYSAEWIQRFRNGYPEAYMDSSSRGLYVKILREEGLL